jgi:dephospho-CoA kinase
MALSGYASWNIDRNATIAGAITEQLYKNGVITNEALESIVSNRGFYQAMTEKAEKHAGPVAALDAASFGLARLTPFGAVTRLAGGGAGAARWAARGDHLFQFGLQGSLGAGGEALGQINAEGKVVSWGDVVAEFAGEGFTAPVEVAAATGRFLARSVDERNQAQVRSEIMKKAGEIAKASAVVQAAPETATEYISEVGQRTEADTVLVDAESLHQEGLADKLAAVSPSAAAQMEEARRTGTEIAIPVSLPSSCISRNSRL